MNGELDARTGVKETIPTVLGYIGIGLAFGIIAHTSGFTALEATLMSLLVYTGAGEFALVSMYAAGSSVFAIALAVTLMSSRMLLMSLTLAPKFKEERLVKNLWLGFLLTDETFALAITKLNYTDGKLSYDWLNASNLMAYLTWAGSSCLGALLGSLVPDTKALGLDFAVAAMFLGLLYLQLISDKIQSAADYDRGYGPVDLPGDDRAAKQRGHDCRYFCRMFVRNGDQACLFQVN